MLSARRPTTVTRVIPIPKDKVGHVIGRRGSRIKEIREQTGVQISINKENQALLSMSKCGKDNKGNRDGKSSLVGKRRLSVCI